MFALCEKHKYLQNTPNTLHTSNSSTSNHLDPVVQIRERHWSIRDLATWLDISYAKSMDLFGNHPETLKIRHHKKGKRKWVQRRVPDHVRVEVYRQLQNGGGI